MTRHLHPMRALLRNKRARVVLVALGGLATLVTINLSSGAKSFVDVAAAAGIQVARGGEIGAAILKTGFKAYRDKLGPGSDIFVLGSPSWNK